MVTWCAPVLGLGCFFEEKERLKIWRVIWWVKVLVDVRAHGCGAWLGHKHD